MKQRRLLFAPYLVPPTPRWGDRSWKAFTEEREGGERLKEVLEKREKSGLEKMGRDSFVWCSTLFSWRIMGLLQGCLSSNDSVFACAHGDCECLRLDACAGFMERMELALWSCEWMTQRGWRYAREVSGGIFVVSLRMNARVLSVLFESIGCGGEWGVVCQRAPPSCPEVKLQLPIQTREVVLFSAAIKCAMYYVACLKTYTL